MSATAPPTENKFTDSASSSKQTSDGCLRFEEPSQQLLPGIPDDIAVHLIGTKLTWKTFRILSSVSRAWKQELQRRQDALLPSLATETSTSVFFERRALDSLLLFAWTDVDCFYELPRIPNVDTGFPREFLSGFLDGKVYIMGGGQDQLYVMDLVAVRQWEQFESKDLPDGLERSISWWGSPWHLVYGGEDELHGIGEGERSRRRIDVEDVHNSESNTWDAFELWLESSGIDR